MDFFGSIYDTPELKNEESEFLNIYSLTDDFDKKTILRTKVYTEVLKRVHSKIKQASTNLKKQCTIPIPEYVMGMPLYDYNNCKLFLMNRLIKEGFDLKFFVPNILFISWAKVVNKDERVRIIKSEPIRFLKPKLKVSSNIPSEMSSSMLNYNFDDKPVRQVSWKDKQKKNKLTYVPNGLFD
jgi:hypothetical protein